MSEPTAHQGDNTADVNPHEHCSRNETRKILRSFSRHEDTDSGGKLSHQREYEEGGHRRIYPRLRFVFLQIYASIRKALTGKSTSFTDQE